MLKVSVTIYSRPGMHVFREGRIHADGTEQIIVLDEVPGNYARYLEGYISLRELSGSNSVTVRIYIKINGVDYEKYFEKSYTGKQPFPLLYIVTKPTKYGVKITLQQTVGLNSFYYQFFRRWV